MIQINNVTKNYPNGPTVLKDISLHIKPGELFVLIGPSGCGKTTTMKMLNRLIEPSSGQILIQGQDVRSLNPVELRRSIGYVIQNIGLLPHMTIAENVALVPRLKKWDVQKYEKKIDELLAMVGLEPTLFRHRYPSELSGGQQQRIGVIRALAADPAIILMDEPFSALDPISREQLQDDLLKLQQELHKTIIFVTHDMDEALKIADRICLMQGGKIIQIDTPENILRHPANEFVASFIGEKRLAKASPFPSLEEIMVRAVTAAPQKGLAEAVSIMATHKVDSLMITDHRKKFLGVVRVWDIQKHFFNETMTLGDLLDSKIPKITMGQSSSEAIRLLSKHQVPTLPVLSSSGELLGVITRASFVDLIAKRQSDLKVV